MDDLAHFMQMHSVPHCAGMGISEGKITLYTIAAGAWTRRHVQKQMVHRESKSRLRMHSSA